MIMSTCGKAMDGPAVLQLQTWGPLQSQIKLSDFCEASISPTRKLLLLLSCHCEALLIPLLSGNASPHMLMNGDDSGKFCSEKGRTTTCVPLCSQDKAAMVMTNLLDDVPCLASNCYPIISDVKSLAWGHFGDAYNQNENSGFRELLIVSSDNGVIAHAFRYMDKSTQNIERTPEDGSVHGKWVEWGPSHNIHLEEQVLSDFGSSESLHHISGVDGTERKISTDGDSGHVSPSSSSFTHKNWFRTFLTELDSSLYDCKYMVKFPQKSSLPHSAEVVSFSIYDSTLKFLGVRSRSNYVSDRQENCSSETVGSLDSEVVISESRPEISSLEERFSCQEGPASIPYKCSRVFSSMSYRYIGLVLTLPEDTATKTCEESWRHASEILVVVIMLHEWGIEWLCSVDLQDLYPGPVPGSEWADFQFLDDFLVSLSTSGLIFFWDAKSGKLVAHLNVLHSCGLNSEVHSELDRSKEVASGDPQSKMTNVEEEIDQSTKVGGSGTYARDIACMGTFKQLMVVSSHSFLLACIDEYGVIYVVCPDDYISKDHYLQHSDVDMFSSWKVAGCEIGRQKEFSEVFIGKGLNFLDIPYRGSSKVNQDKNPILKKSRTQYYDCENIQLEINSSGFATASQEKGRKLPHFRCNMSSSPIRRIFLPSSRYKKGDSICFSPFGITRLIRSCNSDEQKTYVIVHTCLHIASSDERDPFTCLPFSQESAFFGESIGCSFQGCLYLVTQAGISVILPSISVSSSVCQLESIKYWQPNTFTRSKYQMKNLLEINVSQEYWRPWQIEVLDRALLYEGPDKAELICLENGWDLKIARVRRLQLALHYLKYDEIEKSLDMLVHVNMAEEGILRLLFTTVYEIFCKVGSENEVALASRLLALAACFATKMVRIYGLVEHKKDKLIFSVKKDIRISYVQPILRRHSSVNVSNSMRLSEMAHFLEVIRNLQSRISAKNKKIVQGVMLDGRDSANMVDTDVRHDDSPLPIVAMSTISLVPLDALELQGIGELKFPGPESISNDIHKRALQPIESSVDALCVHGDFTDDTDAAYQRALFPLEKSRDMILRWGMDNLDLKTVVKDALHSGRLPLAVLQLHMQHQRALDSEKESHDTFCEIQDVGRAIAYDLFLKGESGLAVEILRRLGEDIEFILRQLLLGTVRRSLRAQIAQEMKKYGYLRPQEWKTLERMYLVERLYPNSNFWETFLGRQKKVIEAWPCLTLPEVNNLKIILHTCDNLIVECGEIDGVVIGSWANVDGGSSPYPSVCEDNDGAGYWSCAALWSDAWDHRTIDRIVLDQPFHLGVHVPWESQFEYYVSHNELMEVCKLLDVIPTSLLSWRTLKVNLNDSSSTENVRSNVNSSDHALYLYDAEELEPVCMNVPHIKIFRSSSVYLCSSWLKMHMEEELAKKNIFLQEYWGSTAEIVPLLARAGLVTNLSEFPIKATLSSSSTELNLPNVIEADNEETAQALHKLVVYYCTQYNFPSFLDLYLDHHNLALTEDSISSLLEAAGDCHWARWLLLSRIKGHEYESSLSNARSNLSRQMILGCNLSVLDIDDIVHTVDDMAEGAGEMAALATLMYAAVPMQNCISTGSVNRNCSSSSQCTLENLRPGLQRFPTLWRTLVAACFGQDLNGCLVSSNAINVYGKSPFLDYMKWRDSLFFSAGGDTSLVQMLPCWFSKHIRRLIKLFVQGPFGWETLSTVSPDGEFFLHKESSYIFNINRHAGFNAVSWEASIQKSIEKELYSSLEENGFGVEHHLRRGRALAAFNHILGLRAQNLKSISANQELPGQANAHSDIQMLLSPLTPNEGSLLSSVIPLAIMHFEDSVLVASCAFLLELCGLSANILRVDVAVLLRISSHYDSIEDNAAYELVSPKGSFHAVYHAIDLTASLARALADSYIHHDYLKVVEQDFPTKVSAGRQPQCSLMTVLQHLEKASLPVMEEGRTCGFWLSSGVGDGSEFRSQQKDASQQWNLVTKFCQMHNLPLSTKYLALLANDNDWVGFLKEAQLGGFSIDIIIQVAAKEFSDPRLKIHILTVLKNMQSTKKKNSSSTNTLSVERNDELPFSNECNTIVPMELFALLAECEKQKNPGEALLTKAKDLHWPLLAIIASCFPDVSPLSCLTVWLEITASRETSAIKVNDIYTKIANSVGAAIEATNTLPPGSRTVTVRYNRKNPKRRRLLEPSVEYSPVGSSCNFINVVSPTTLSISQEIAKEDEGKSLVTEQAILSGDAEKGLALLSNMVAVLCEQHLFLPLLRSFEMFMPSCSLLPFIRSLQAFCQMRLSEASAHLASFSARIKDEHFLVQINTGKDGHVKTAWISSTSVKAAEAMLSTCPSAYEKRCLLQLLAAADFGDGGSAATYFRRLYWKINLAEPSLRRDDNLYLGNETLDDASLLAALEKHGHWEQARNWARQLESGGASWKFAVHHVTEMQAEAMVAEWKEFLWDIPEERAALWSHCQTLFLRHSFPALQAGSFFLKHAEEIDKEISARELHEMLLLSLQWLSGTITQSNPVYPLHLLREIETRVWLLAVESEAQTKAEGDFTTPSVQNLVGGNSTSVIEQTANIITKMDNHINQVHARATERNGTRENNLTQYRHVQILDFDSLVTATSSSRTKRRAKIHMPLRRPAIDSVDSSNDSDDSPNSPNNFKSSGELSRNPQLQEENAKVEVSVSGWEEKVKPADLERAVLSLLEFGQIVAAKQLQQKLSPTHVPSELVIVDAALKLAALSSSYSSGEISESVLDPEVLSIIQSSNIPRKNHMIDTLQALESLATKCGQGCGRGICRRIIAVVKAAKVLGLHFSEAFEKRPIELLQLLSLKAQDSLEEAKLLVQTHVMPPSSIARILAESFLKGLLAAHRGGYIDSQKEEGPAPLLWRFSDFLKWAELCPSESEIGHALMRLVMTGQDIPHACEVELLILSHHFYQSSACLDGVDVLVTLAANRVESYVLEGDFSCLARLVTGVSNFHALNFILNILIENGQLELLLQKYSTAETAAGTAEAVRGFRMAVLTSLKLFNPHDLDAFAMVYNHFDMKHETASLLESRSVRDIQQWHRCRDRDRQHEDLLEAMRHLIEAAEVHSTIDAGHKTHRACARASLLSLQIRIPDLQWLDLSETNARRVLVEQSRFQEALIVAEAYNLNQPSEWALVLWNQMLKPDLVEQFVAEFVAVLPLQPSMLLELARFYRAEVAARGDQSHFSVWLSPGGLPAEWVKHLGRSFRSLLKGTRDLRVRVQLATIATGFAEVIDACMKVLDKVPDNAGPLILRKGHGGAYLPLM